MTSQSFNPASTATSKVSGKDADRDKHSSGRFENQERRVHSSIVFRDAIAFLGLTKLQHFRLCHPMAFEVRDGKSFQVDLRDRAALAKVPLLRQIQSDTKADDGDQGLL